MENKDIINTFVSSSDTTAVPDAAAENGANNGTTRGRRHRRPAAKKTAPHAEETVEAQPVADVIAPTTPEMAVAEATSISTDAPPPPSGRTPRHRRNTGRSQTKETRATEPSPATESAPEPLPTPTFESSVTETAAEPAAPELPPELARPQRRYRFDRPAQPTGTTDTVDARRLGPLSTIWRNPTAPTPPPVTEEVVPPPEEHVITQEETVPEPPMLEEEPSEAFLVAEQEEPAQPESDLEPLDLLVTTPETSTDSANEDSGHAGANRRNHRRRRGRSTANGAQPELHTEEPAPPPMAASLPIAPTTVRAPRYQPQQPPPPAYEPPVTPAVAPYTPDFAGPPARNPSPFGSPEPAHARGFGPTPRGVASEFRTAPAPRISRVDRSSEGNAPISPNHLASIIMEAMQQQTDRLLSEQRRNASTPMFTVAMPSTERVGVFVDVANLLYSSRSMRIPIDFGKLLDFLRSNRRLVRAHAYCPTSPEPYADQQFLQAVKGLGYRITTKDYKTFSSGAKKADLDLDLCMDIVRIVDAQAVDTIVLVSGDSDFLPLLAYCSDHGVRVEVAAFDESTAAILRQSCDLFLNLSLVEEIRA
jgi:uncharacterized LabA/DUF88 family protein